MSEHIKLKITKIIPRTSDAIEIVFQDDSQKIKDFYPGQFLTFLLNINGKNIRRSYSICSSPSELPTIAVCVKRVKDGLASNHLADNAKANDIIEVIEPYGQFNINHNLPSLPELVLFGAGSGITPLMSILKTSLSKNLSPKVRLYFGNTNTNTIIFKKELEDLVALYPEKLSVVHILTNPIGTWDGPKGRITAELVKSIVQYEKLENTNADFYLCGPHGMMDSVSEGLENLNIDKKKIHREVFFTTPENPTKLTTDELSKFDKEEINVGHVVKIIYEGQEHSVTVSPGNFILDAAIDAGLDLPYACQMGICGMCRARKVTGHMHIAETQESLSASEIKNGACLTCCGTPLSHDLVIDYDKK